MGSNPSTKTTICGGNGGANGKRNHVIVHSWITLCRVFMAEQHRKRELQWPKLPFDPQNLANDHRTLEFQDFKQLVYLNSNFTLHMFLPSNVPPKRRKRVSDCPIQAGTFSAQLFTYGERTKYITTVGTTFYPLHVHIETYMIVNICITLCRYKTHKYIYIYTRTMSWFYSCSPSTTCHYITPHDHMSSGMLDASILWRYKCSSGGICTSLISGFIGGWVGVSLSSVSIQGLVTWEVQNSKSSRPMLSSSHMIGTRILKRKWQFYLIWIDLT